jgi:hypothetical protein
VLAALAMTASLIAWPPRDEYAAGWRLVAGLTFVFLFAPASRFGYFVYPLGLSAWLLLAPRAGNWRTMMAGPWARIRPESSA